MGISFGPVCCGEGWGSDSSLRFRFSVIGWITLVTFYRTEGQRASEDSSEMRLNLPRLASSFVLGVVRNSFFPPKARLTGDGVGAGPEQSALFGSWLLTLNATPSYPRQLASPVVYSERADLLVPVRMFA